MRSHSSAASAESPPEQVSIARPSALGRARAGDRQRLRELEQLVEVGRPGGARLLHERAEDALVAGQRARVRGGSRRAGRGAPHLQHRDPDAVLGAAGERLAEERAVAVGLQVERDRADPLVGGQLGDPAGRIERHRVAARDHGVEAQAAARVERVDREVAALRDERHAARPRRAAARPPRARPARGAPRCRCRSGRTPAGRGRPRPPPARPRGPRPPRSRRSPLRRRRRRRSRACPPPRQPRRHRRRGSPPRPRRAARGSPTATGSGPPVDGVAARVDTPDLAG